ncbi:MAG: hypothetical protein GY828_02075, partial [Candidatus Gracilibacteria bacterium]|nr:hypothetical protein [Candidatus Gracilibacteria bacterium]
VEAANKEVQNHINQLREKYYDILNIEILEQEKILDLLNKQKLKYERKRNGNIDTDIPEEQIETQDEIEAQHEIETLSYGILVPDKNYENGLVSMKKEGNEVKETRFAPKFNEVMSLLEKMGIEIQGNIYEETISEDRLRAEPYKIIHIELNGKKKTLLVSDEIGQATFIYAGNIEALYLKNSIKGVSVNDIKVSKIGYSDNYSSRLESCLMDQDVFGYIEDEKIVNDSTKQDINIDQGSYTFAYRNTPNNEEEKKLLSIFGLHSKSLKTAYKYLHNHKIDDVFVKEAIQDAVTGILGTTKQVQALNKDHFPGYKNEEGIELGCISDIFDTDFLRSPRYQNKVLECLEELEQKEY